MELHASIVNVTMNEFIHRINHFSQRRRGKLKNKLLTIVSIGRSKNSGRLFELMKQHCWAHLTRSRSPIIIILVSLSHSSRNIGRKIGKYLLKLEHGKLLPPAHSKDWSQPLVVRYHHIFHPQSQDPLGPLIGWTTLLRIPWLRPLEWALAV